MSRFLTLFLGGLIPLILAAVLVLLLPCDVLARAGGGGGYGGGGGGGGGGFSSGSGYSSGGGKPLTPLNATLFFGFVAFCIVMSIWGGVKAKSAHRGSVIRRMTDAERLEALAALRESDPEFDEQPFYDRVRVAFMKIQKAWCEHDLEPIRPFVSDGIYERFSLQILEQKDLGYRDHMEKITIERVQLAELASDDLFDVLSLRIRASAVDYRVSLEGGRRLSGAKQADSFTEYWTFLRRSGAKTGNQPGLIEGNCPNCGTPIDLNQAARCDSCDSLLRSGEYDWVLAEITQACEWSQTGAMPGGVAEYRADRDRGFHVQHLEDRASVVFWRKVMADRLAEVAPLAKMATPEFCDQYARQLAPAGQPADAKASRTYRGDCAVGSVDTLGVLPGDKMDRALVGVRWSGKMFTVRPGKPPKCESHGSLFRHLFVFARRRGVQTDVNQSITSAHCPGCGAPESKLTSHACEFCGEVLNDGSHDWVLIDILPMAGDEAQALEKQLKQQTHAETTESDPPAIDMLAWAVKMALADHHVDPKERSLLERVAAKRGVSPDRLDTIIEAAQRDELEIQEPSNREAGRRWIRSMARVSLSDGRVDRREYALLCQVGAKFDYTAHDIKRMLKKSKAELYQAARSRLRAAKRNQSNKDRSENNGAER